MDGLKRYVNDDRFRVDGDKNMRLLAFAFTIVFVWTGPQIGRLLHILTHGAPLARFARESSAIIFLYKVTQGVNHADKWRSREVLNEGVLTFTDFT